MKPLLFAFAVALLCLSACSTTTPVSGEVFVVTKGAASQKLGGIEVLAVGEKDVKKYLADWKNDLKNEIGKFDKYAEQKCVSEISLFFVNKECVEIVNRPLRFADFLFKSSIPITAETVSDSNGAFQLNLSEPGSFILLAKGSRMVGDETEQYFWLQKVESDGKEKKVILSNNNMVSVKGFMDMMNEIPE